MALAQDFKETLVRRAKRDPRFRQAIFTEALNACLAGDTRTGKAMLRDLVNATSHRGFIAQFRRAVGLAPKAFQRVLRFQRALRELRRGDALACVAADAGYSDQAHFGREFLEFSGVTPAAYRSRRPEHANHVPVNILQYAGAPEADDAPACTRRSR